MLGGPQKAWADDRVCVCPPGPDTPGTTSYSRDAVTRVDARPALAVVTPWGGAGGGSVHSVRLLSGFGQMVMMWIKGCHLSRLFAGPSPVSRPPLPGQPGEMECGGELTSAWAVAEGTEAQVPAGWPQSEVWWKGQVSDSAAPVSPPGPWPPSWAPGRSFTLRTSCSPQNVPA